MVLVVYYVSFEIRCNANLKPVRKSYGLLIGQSSEEDVGTV